MRMSRVSLLVGLVFVLLTSLPLPASVARAQAASLAITLQPESGPPGTAVTIFGRGAPPSAEVRVLFAYWSRQIDCRAGRDAELVTVVTADQNGLFTATHQASRTQTDQLGITYLAELAGPPPAARSPLECFPFETPGIFPQTGYRIDYDPFLDYVSAYGGVETFGFPVSRSVTVLGCTTQFFQRHVLQRCADGAVRPLNLLDPGLMPVQSINYSTFPAHDPAVASAAPPPNTPNYGQAALTHVQSTVPNTFEGLPVGFFSTFVNSVPDAPRNPALTVLANLEVWGFPTSQPAFDPNNRNFVYQRFQRGIMHYSNADQATRGILLGDWFKSVITGENLPADLAAQMQGNRFLRQYCPANPRSLCRPSELPETDLSAAFVPHATSP
ncbi:MAG TPA: hypothetical protein VGW38_06990 [Chloroflexota bacterium]|nr:hypothetical protein [Chloroflexota bacterium]